jgi:Domain of unknown function (DUF5127)
VTYQVSAADAVRSQFAKSGNLENSIDAQYQILSDPTVVFAFSHHVGPVSTHDQSQESPPHVLPR